MVLWVCEPLCLQGAILCAPGIGDIWQDSPSLEHGALRLLEGTLSCGC